MAHDLLQRIRQRLDELNRSERKVADVILADPARATGLSIASLAQAASVSEPTVNRFCRSFNAKGYPDFKIKLAQSLAGGTPYVSQSVEPGDGAADYTRKIFGATIAALDEASRTIDPARIERVVDYLIQAKQIHFFGLGASGAVAQDAQHKFFRFNLPVTSYVDVLMQRMVASACHTGDVVVVISWTGRTRELVEIAQLARESGAVVLGITAPGSPLAAECTETLEVPTPEDTDVYMPMTSRMIQLTLIDVLATGVTLRRGEDFLPHLKKIKDSLRETRYPPGARG
ncbi:MAG: MurR/RpiR family transcriptional regulator [Halomonas sp.]|jgi:RpiR family carbohydrate utilization transcriptional regulator|uniref:MurR/RpiR family transcriptional regulator n=1 Tax=Billgrantia tianxiuensis TaxID=2497861 RepID=A0A6I6SK65_9GAMM|nr:MULTISPECIES: MurR/RpiR family transcriptional regulator [Halomonas]MCE8034148.1 MurR/RpiR family transcriptional regulator [Halomonas sp. MCCC 1A11057]MDX5433788.1 MurR/RpiR family transcriptional regulator [Halomonas sp.]QHC51019.1 MurR/RpiR family transcriptional regulator [Halomonas tianxiuensis]